MRGFHDRDSLLRAQAFELSQPADVYTFEQFKTDHETQYNEMIDTFAREAVERFGRQDNNWLKIIPELIHTVANDVSERGYSIVKHDVVRPAGKEYQATLYDKLYADYDEQPELDEHEQHMSLDPASATNKGGIMSVTTNQLNGMSHVEMMKRMTQLTSGTGDILDSGEHTVQYKDPWTAARVRQHANKRETSELEQKPADL